MQQKGAQKAKQLQRKYKKEGREDDVRARGVQTTCSSVTKGRTPTWEKPELNLFSYYTTYLDLFISMYNGVRNLQLSILLDEVNEMVWRGRTSEGKKNL